LTGQLFVGTILLANNYPQLCRPTRNQQAGSKPKK